VRVNILNSRIKNVWARHAPAAKRDGKPSLASGNLVRRVAAGSGYRVRDGMDPTDRESEVAASEHVLPA